VKIYVVEGIRYGVGGFGLTDSNFVVLAGGAPLD
jgi:hypothetical protein